MDSAVQYFIPDHWIKYDLQAIVPYLVDAKASIISLKATPYQKDWVNKLQEMQLRMEVAGTSRIEGADFTENEFDDAVNSTSPDLLFTRSQRQARAAAGAYRWIAEIAEDEPITEEFIREVHRRMVVGCDDDHCPPGLLRGADVNVTFGIPRHRGCEGGQPCRLAFSKLAAAVNREFKHHDPLIQAIALHYHFAAMHPFLDGNGRTARALEALILQRAGLRDSAFVAMSNYYHEEKQKYLDVLAQVRSQKHDLTHFLIFGLQGVALQCERLFREIKKNVQKAVFKNLMYDLFQRLESPRKRVLRERQIQILKILLEVEQIEITDLIKRTTKNYEQLGDGFKAVIRDLGALINIGAISAVALPATKNFRLDINLNWPEEITETDFAEKIKEMPKGKVFSFL